MFQDVRVSVGKTQSLVVMQLQGAGLSQRLIPAHLWYLDEDDSGSGPGVAS